MVTTLPDSLAPVAVMVAVDVAVEVDVAVCVKVDVTVSVLVAVKVDVDVSVGVEVKVEVLVEVLVSVCVTAFLDLVGFSIIFPLFPQLLRHYLALEGHDSLIGHVSDTLEAFAGKAAKSSATTAYRPNRHGAARRTV